ncbi:protein of unknown function [Serratia sp. Tan611]|nr:protein of unknown function [Serratia sp. Tan611]
MLDLIDCFLVLNIFCLYINALMWMLLCFVFMVILFGKLNLHILTRNHEPHQKNVIFLLSRPAACLGLRM